MTHRFADDVVRAVCRHMDDDHAEDALLLARHLGGAPDAVEARTVGVDGDGLVLLATRPGGEQLTVRVPFAEPVTERPQVRMAVVELYRRACAAVGVTPRDEVAAEVETGAEPA